MIMRNLRYAVFISCLGLVASAEGQKPSSEGVQFFESKIRPVLVKHCYKCHSTESGKVRGGLKVDSRDAVLRGGDSGPAVVAKSLESTISAAGF